MHLIESRHCIRIVKDPAVGDMVLVRLDGLIAPAVVTKVHSPRILTVVAFRDDNSSPTRVITSSLLDPDLEMERTWCPRD